MGSLYWSRKNFKAFMAKIIRKTNWGRKTPLAWAAGGFSGSDFGTEGRLGRLPDPCRGAPGPEPLSRAWGDCRRPPAPRVLQRRWAKPRGAHGLPPPDAQKERVGPMPGAALRGPGGPRTPAGGPGLGTRRLVAACPGGCGCGCGCGALSPREAERGRRRRGCPGAARGDEPARPWLPAREDRSSRRLCPNVSKLSCVYACEYKAFRMHVHRSQVIA